jgi:predicted RNA-binding Zn ribbon-like protein
MPTPMKFVGGLACLDFVNTVGGWLAGSVIDDKLESFADLIRWAELAGLSAGHLAGRSTRAAASVLARAHALRLALHRVLNRAIDKRRPQPGDLEVVRAELGIARKHQEFTVESGKFRWTFDDTGAPDFVLWQISQSAADLLTSPDIERVRRCAGETCGWMFLDMTRNHSRHWCDMKDCGNRAKVQRFRQRRA